MWNWHELPWINVHHVNPVEDLMKVSKKWCWCCGKVIDTLFRCGPLEVVSSMKHHDIWYTHESPLLIFYFYILVLRLVKYLISISKHRYMLGEITQTPWTHFAASGLFGQMEVTEQLPQWCNLQFHSIPHLFLF